MKQQSIKLGIEILEQIKQSTPQEYLNNNITWGDMVRLLNKLDKEDRIARKKAAKDLENNLKALSKKAKELNKEIPNELYITIYLNQPQGSWFFEKYKEWFE